MRLLRAVVFACACLAPAAAAGEPAAMPSVASIGDLEAPDAMVAPRPTVHVLSYYPGGTGGGGVFTLVTPCPVGAADRGVHIFPAGGKASCYVRQEDPATLDNAKFGAKCDGATARSDDTAANQAYLDYLASLGGGTAHFTCGRVRGLAYTISNGLQYHSGVVIDCGAQPGTQATGGPGSITIVGTGRSPWIVGPDANGPRIMGAGILGCRIVGAGKDRAQGGVLLEGGYGRLERNRFANIGEECILADDKSQAWHVLGNIADNCLLNYQTAGALTVRKGAMTIRGTDSVVADNEISAAFPGVARVTDPVHLFRTAIYYTDLRGSIFTSRGNEGEFGDVGIYYDNGISSGVHGDNASQNFGPGIVASVNAFGSFFGVSTNNNSRNAKNAYDEILVDPGASAAAPGGRKAFFGVTFATTAAPPKGMLTDSSIGSARTKNTYDAATTSIAGDTAYQLSRICSCNVKGFSNTPTGAYGETTQGPPVAFTAPAGASNFCVDAQGDRGSYQLSAGGGAASVTVAKACGGQIQGWTGMTLNFFIGAGVTVLDSSGAPKTTAKAPHQMVMTAAGNWVWAY